jgi:hypothetical protein
MIKRNEIELAELRRQDIVREAEYLRKIGEAAGGTYFYRPVLSWTGRRLMRLGFKMLVWSKEWEHRANTVYNGSETLLSEPVYK